MILCPSFACGHGFMALTSTTNKKKEALDIINSQGKNDGRGYSSMHEMPQEPIFKECY
jgi:hypothetical protein